MNIYLIGMMGSGKTATAKALAKLIPDVSVVDLDEKLQSELGMTISEIFEKRGEAFFREQESMLLSRTWASKNAVVSTGGGVILNPRHVEGMKNNGTVIYLETSFEWLWKRVKDKTHRPLLHQENPEAALKDIYRQRKEIYESAAHIRVNTDAKTPAQVAEEIVQRLKDRS